jgi:hypothetical protein
MHTRKPARRTRTVKRYYHFRLDPKSIAAIADELRDAKNWLAAFKGEYTLPKEVDRVLHQKLDNIGDKLAALGNLWVPVHSIEALPKASRKPHVLKPAPKPKPKRPHRPARRPGKGEHARVVVMVDLANQHAKKEQLTLTETDSR